MVLLQRGRARDQPVRHPRPGRHPHHAEEVLPAAAAVLGGAGGGDPVGGCPIASPAARDGAGGGGTRVHVRSR